jgi:mannose-6-phosphate isomerase-like protein (cupin superfamily)
MREKIRKPVEQDECLTDEGCWILELSNDAEDPAVSIARARVPPGQTTKWHKVIGIEERYVILQGSGRVELGNLAPAAVGPGEIVRIPAGDRQRITNTGTDDLMFLCICTPRFEQAYYRSLE